MASRAPGTSTGLVEGWMIGLIADRQARYRRSSGVFAVCSTRSSRPVLWGCCCLRGSLSGVCCPCCGRRHCLFDVSVLGGGISTSCITAVRIVWIVWISVQIVRIRLPHGWLRWLHLLLNLLRLLHQLRLLRVWRRRLIHGWHGLSTALLALALHSAVHRADRPYLERRP